MIYYKVANHVFGISMIHEDTIDSILPAYQSFKVSEQVIKKENLLFTLSCVEYGSLKEYTGKLNQTGDSDLGNWTLLESEDYYITDIQYYPSLPKHRMVCDKEFRDCRAALMLEEPFGKAVFNSFISMTFSQACLLRNTVILHASVIMKDGIGYAFLGKSGTGKSTHSQQWLTNIASTELLNDDNPAVRILPNNEIKIYGTPWSGKTPCYKNKEALLGGFVQLKQAPENKIKKLNGIEAYIILLASSSSIKNNQVLYNAVGNSIEKIVNKVPVLYLENLPNKEAALLSYNTFISLQNNKK